VLRINRSDTPIVSLMISDFLGIQRYPTARDHQSIKIHILKPV
jgi:hypothetical protein